MFLPQFLLQIYQFLSPLGNSAQRFFGVLDLVEYFESFLSDFIQCLVNRLLLHEEAYFRQNMKPLGIICDRLAHPASSALRLLALQRNWLPHFFAHRVALTHVLDVVESLLLMLGK